MTHEKIRRRGFQGVAASALLAQKTKMALAVGGDHAGFALKGPVIALPDIAQKVCDEILSKRADRGGILVCGTGAGACIAGNKVKCIRAALCHDTFSAHQCMKHDDVNFLCMGAWIIGPKGEILAAYLNATFSTGEDYRRRVRKLSEMEKR